MTSCISHGVSVGATAVACASTGNTSASMAAYAARAGLPALLFVPEGAVSAAKLAQAIDFGARVVEAGTNFDQAFVQLRQVAEELGWYVVNSINPYRLEGQKTVILELLEQRQWRVPDYLLVPGGNLGNVSAVGKGLLELAVSGPDHPDTPTRGGPGGGVKSLLSPLVIGAGQTGTTAGSTDPSLRHQDWQSCQLAQGAARAQVDGRQL